MALPSEWVDRIFERLTVLFGRRFGDLYAGVDPQRLRDAWAVELAGFESQPDRIAKALHSLKGAQHPPTLSEFIALCRQQHSEPSAGLLSAPRGNADVARANLKKVREMLRGSVKVVE